MTMKHEYDKDFYAWANHNAALIRQRKFTEIDIENIAEEVEALARSEKRLLINRLSALITHLLKWEVQTAWRTDAWKCMINAHRSRIAGLLQESPSLLHEMNDKLEVAYEYALTQTICDTGLDEKTFHKYPFTLEQCLDDKFFPD